MAVNNSKNKDIGQNIDENGITEPYGMDDMLYDNYGWEYVDGGYKSIDYWEILNEMKKEDVVMKCITIEDDNIDENIWCIGILLDRINENNVLDVILKINEKNVENTEFLRIITSYSYKDKYEEFFIKDYNDYDDYNNNHAEAFRKMLSVELEVKGLLKYILALNI